MSGKTEVDLEMVILEDKQMNKNKVKWEKVGF